VGIVPQQAPGELARLWTPVLKYLEEKTGLALQFETAKDVATFDKRMLAGGYDIVYANPLAYAVALHPRLGYEAFAREKDRKLVGLLVVRKDSRYQSVADLAASELAFPAEAALAASVIPRAQLDKLGIAYTPHYLGSHDSVFLAVAKGLYAGGGGVARTLEMLPGPTKEQLRVLWTSAGLPPHPFAAHPKVSADIVLKLQAALVAMEGDPAGQAILKPLAFTGFMATKDADYEIVRSLGYKLPGF
jgi:phosphonate transport system substrate-binding protein